MYVVKSSDGTLYGPWHYARHAAEWANANEEFVGDWSVEEVHEAR